VRVLLLCGALLLAAPASAPAAARPSLGVIDVATGHRTVLARGAENSEGWSSVRWTPDGSAIVALRLERRGLVVRRYATAGGARRLRDLGDALDGVLSWDGALVAALYDGGQGLRGGRGGVVVRDVATGRVRLRLPQSAEGDDLYENGLEVAWSRDSARLAYIAYEGSRRTLRIADPRSGRVLRRLDASRIYLGPETFSPAGDRMAYGFGNNGRLTLLDVATGAVRRFGETGVFDVAWAPAGERLAASVSAGVIVSDEQQRFGLPQPAGDSVAVLRWSPDGTMVGVLIQNQDDYRTELAVMPVAPSPGALRVVVPYRDSGIGPFQWSPDGRRIAYAG
jgi:dipeptidyl aminopeptidase/acylaminoacyl peptidase